MSANLNKKLRVLALSAFPIEAAATRFRLGQFVEPLRKLNIELTICPFLNSGQFKRLYTKGSLVGKVMSMASPLLKRLAEAFSSRKYDVVLVQREAMLFGPGLVEWFIANVGRRPIVLDLDDATYVRYVSPTYGRLGSFLKFMGKTDKLIGRAKLVTCGNRFIAEYVESKGSSAVVIPTVVDLNRFRPRDVTPKDAPLAVGWIGTHSTFPFLESILPVLADLAARHKFILRVVGGARYFLEPEGLDVKASEWSLTREIEDFRSLDIGLYPITTSASASEDWIRGKSGFKAIQYMAVGVPFVMSPVGICGEIGEPGLTHFNAETPEDWYNSLDRLLTDADLRAKMGVAGRKHAVENYDLESHASMLAEALKSVAQG